ncbi:MAG: zinc-dependent alcohol dehydrogenase [bacterium]
MKALIRKNGHAVVEEVAEPQLDHTEDVKIKVITAGLCRTDVYAMNGEIPVQEPLILGHEFCGEVIESGPDSPFNPGDVVTANPLIKCGECDECKAGRECSRPHFLGLQENGAFAEEISVPAGNLFPVESRVDPRRAAYTEPLAAALAVLKAPINPTDHGAIIGDGRIAELTYRVLKHYGFESIERGPTLSFANKANQMDFAIEAEATPSSLHTLLKIVKQGGTAILKSRPASPVPFDVNLAVRKDIAIYAVGYGSFDEAVRLLSEGELPVDDLLGPSYPLDQYTEAVQAAYAPDAPKIFFDIGKRGD